MPFYELSGAKSRDSLKTDILRRATGCMLFSSELATGYRNKNNISDL